MSYSDYRMIEVDWPYVAGFTDGEGTIKFYRYEPRRGVTVTIAWTQVEENAWVLMEIKEFLESHGIFVSEYYWEREYVTCGAIRRIAVQRQEHVRKVLENLMPYLIVKAADAQAVLKSLDEWQAENARPLRRLA